MRALGQKALGQNRKWRTLYLLSLGIVIAASLGWANYFENSLMSRIDKKEPVDSSLTHLEAFSPGVLPQWWYSTRGTVFFYNVVWYAAMMGIIHAICRRFWIRSLSREKYYTVRKLDRYLLAEKVPSSIHGTVCGITSVYLLFFTDAFSTNVIGGYHPICDWFCAFSFGYEIYDLTIMILQRDFGIVMWIHHSSLLVGYILIVSYQRLAFVAGVMLITELTVLPSNLHWYLKTFAKKDTRVFHFNQGLRLWSFIILRLTAPPYAWYNLYKNLDEFYLQPMLIRYAVYLITLTLAMMNVYWTWTMFIIYSKRVPLRHKRALKSLSQTVKLNVSMTDLNAPQEPDRKEIDHKDSDPKKSD